MNSEPNILELPGKDTTNREAFVPTSGIHLVAGLGSQPTGVPNPTNSGDPPSEPTTPSPQSPDPVHPAFGTGNRGNGYVARLPKTLRDQINEWILDGVSYPEIISRLGDAGKHLKPGHFSEWKKRGYQDWLLEREWLERLSSKAEFSTDILAAPHSSDLHEAGLRLAASQMFDQLMRFNAASETGASDQPEKFARLVNALSRLTREALAFQKYRDALAKAIVELQKRDPDRDLVANELLLLVNKMDKTFKVARPELARLLAVAAGVPPAVEPGVPPGGKNRKEANGKPTFGHSVPNSSLSASGAADEVSVKNKSDGGRGEVASSSPALRSAFDEGGSASPVQSSEFEVQSSTVPPAPYRKRDTETLTAGPSRPQPEEGASMANSGDHSSHNSHAAATDPTIQQSSNPSPVPLSTINSQPSTTAELCPACRHEIPAVTPEGQRPSPECWFCGKRLLEPNTELCPGCHLDLPSVSPTGERPYPTCRICGADLPPPNSPDRLIFTSYSSGPQPP